MQNIEVIRKKLTAPKLDQKELNIHTGCIFHQSSKKKKKQPIIRYHHYIVAELRSSCESTATLKFSVKVSSDVLVMFEGSHILYCCKGVYTIIEAGKQLSQVIKVFI